MSKKTLSLTLKLTRMGWCLFVDGAPYAMGSRAYCIGVSNDLRRGRAEVSREQYAVTMNLIHSGGRRP